MITREQAMTLPVGTVLYHLKLRVPDGASQCCRVTGKFRPRSHGGRTRPPSALGWDLPVAWVGDFYGSYPLSRHFLSTRAFRLSNITAADWCLFDPTDVYAKAGVGPDAPWQIIHDLLIDNGHEALAELYLADLEASALPS